MYLTASNFPELANLSAKQRQWVEEHCLHWLFHGFWYRLSGFAVMMFSLFIGVYLNQSYKVGMWVSSATSGICIIVLGLVHDRLWLPHFRPKVARFMRLHEADINAVA